MWLFLTEKLTVWIDEILIIRVRLKLDYKDL